MMFQSTPPAEARGDGGGLHACWKFKVSIHSPRRSEGRRHLGHQIKDTAKFQSTPPAEARGDKEPTVRQVSSVTYGFNPLPPPKRGETDPQTTYEQGTSGRSFNPLPPPKRGETGSECLRHALVCFNPLPPPKRGETPVISQRARVVDVSIHSPRRSEGRLADRPLRWPKT